MKGRRQGRRGTFRITFGSDRGSQPLKKITAQFFLVVFNKDEQLVESHLLIH